MRAAMRVKRPSASRSEQKTSAKMVQHQGPAMSDVEGIGEGIFQLAEVKEFVKAVIDAEKQAKSQAQYEGSHVEGGF